MRHLGRLLLCGIMGLISSEFPSVTGAYGCSVVPIDLKGNAAVSVPAPESIRMESQELVIRLARQYYEVDAVFRLFNTGKTSTQRIGFPKPGSGPYDYSTYGFVSFDAWIDGRKVGVLQERDVVESRLGDHERSVAALTGSKPGYIVGEVTFPSGAVTTVRVRYRARYHKYSAYHQVSCGLGPGLFWQGNVKRVVVLIDASRVDGAARVSTELHPTSQPPTLIEENFIGYELTGLASGKPYALFISADLRYRNR